MPRLRSSTSRETGASSLGLGHRFLKFLGDLDSSPNGLENGWNVFDASSIGGFYGGVIMDGERFKHIATDQSGQGGQ